MTRPARPAPRDRGQAAPMMVVVLAATTAILAVVTEVGRLLDESARARTAADAAALAGAAAGRDEAASLAEANGGSLVSYVEETADSAVVVTLSVRVGRATGEARAQGLVEWVPSP